MISLLYGKNNFSSLAQLHNLTATFLQKKQGEIITFEAENFVFEAVRRAISHHGLFQTYKLIILKNCLSEKTDLALPDLTVLLQNIPDEVTLIVYERDTLDKRSSLFKFLEQLTTLEGKHNYPEHLPLEQPALKKWIEEQIKKGGKKIEHEALDYLTHCCRNQWHAHNEIQKLLATDDLIITQNTIKPLLRSPYDDNIFHFTDALVSKNRTEALQLLEDLIALDTDHFYLLAMITRQIKILIKIQSARAELPQASYADIAREINEHPFVVQKTLSGTHRFAPDQLKNIYSRILYVDERFKSTRIDPKVLLTQLVCDIME